MMKYIILFFLTCFFNLAIFSQIQKFDYPKMISEAFQYLKDEEFKKAAYTYTKAFKLNGDKGKVYDRYMCAICWAKVKNTDSTLSQLEKIAFIGKFSHYELVDADEAFYYLRDNKRLNIIIDKMKENYKNLR